VLITMLADDAAVEGVIFAPGNAIRPALRCCSYFDEYHQRGLVAPFGEHTGKESNVMLRRQSSAGLMSPPPGSCGLLPVALPNRSKAANTFRRDWSEDIHGRRGSSRRQRDQVGGEFPSSRL